MITKNIVTFCIPDEIKSLKILLVDDDELMRDVIEETLRNMGIESIRHASDGAEALSQVGSSPESIELMICDLNMPDMDGIELIRHLSQINFQGSIILLSGSNLRLLSTVAALYREYKLDLLDVLEKPIDDRLLADTLMKFLDVSRKNGRVSNKLEMLTPDEIRSGLETGCVVPFFQPKVDAKTQKLLGAECLLRWRDSKRGFISPLAVIPVAEEHGLIDELTLDIFAKAMAILRQCKQRGFALKFSVNISIDSLKHFELPDLLLNITRLAQVHPNEVILEVTESSLMGNLAASLEVITRFRLMGFGLSIDDFGTGYSSMEKLKLMPFTELKVDRAFVFGASRDVVAQAILKSSVDLGHSLNMRVVAEGAETMEDWNIVRETGCDQLQGYVVAKPMPAEEFFDWMMAYQH
jgi:EAL domain-containing protein (putative c-di-GMP-specific phosphodiesterase class I)/FixJ family two-component response regulator